MTGVQSPLSRSRRQISVPSMPGQADVEHAGDRAQPAGGGQARRAVGLDVHAEAVPGQVEPDQVGDRPLVLDDQHQALAGRVTHAATTVTRRADTPARDQANVRVGYGRSQRPRRAILGHRA